MLEHLGGDKLPRLAGLVPLSLSQRQEGLPAEGLVTSSPVSRDDALEELLLSEEIRDQGAPGRGLPNLSVRVRGVVMLVSAL